MLGTSSPSQLLSLFISFPPYLLIVSRQTDAVHLAQTHPIWKEIDKVNLSWSDDLLASDRHHIEVDSILAIVALFSSFILPSPPYSLTMRGLEKFCSLSRHLPLPSIPPSLRVDIRVILFSLFIPTVDDEAYLT